jgi:Domain of unknown function (DUF222)
MGWEPGRGSGSGGSADPNPGNPGLPGIPDHPGGSGLPSRDERLAGFAPGGDWDTCQPSAALAAVLEDASGGEWRCPGATHEELIGLLRQWAALESRVAAGKLGVLRALMRDEDLPPQGGHHGDLPDGWSKSLTREVALALAMSAQSAENMMWLAWDLQARLPGIGALLADGTLNYGKAKAIDDELNLLTDLEIDQAEQLVLARLAEDGSPKSFARVLKIAQQAAITVNPEISTLRRKDAEQTRARVTKSREPSGAVALCGRDLPTDETLSADANVSARAEQYQASGAFPDIRMEQLRAMAFLNLLNSISADERIAAAAAAADEAAGATEDARTSSGQARSEEPGSTRPTNPVPADSAGPDSAGPDSAGPERDAPDHDGPDGDDSPGPGDDGSGNDGPGLGPGGDGDPSGPAQPSLPGSRPRRSDLVLPLVTLLGLADRPGEGHGLGPLDPGLCRDLAIAAAGSVYTEWCITVTNSEGIAIGHGCAGSSRPTRSPQGRRALPARVNLTVTSTQLVLLTGTSRPSGLRIPATCTFTPRDDPGPPRGYGTWVLRLSGTHDLVVKLEPVPTFECDHQRESRAYQPNDKLRHLVQVRDYECTFPTCSRHARDSDFEHAIPYDKGGRTCACNAGARSRQCHIVKQSPGWNVTQPRPGWHQWRTPAGRTYIQGPHRYPV